MTKGKENLLLQGLEPEYCAKLDGLPLPNPFYDNHVFTDEDLQREVLKIDLWERFWLMFRPTYVQLAGDHVFYYKTMGGRYYLIKVQEMKNG